MTTPAEQANGMINDPAWEFDTNPTKAISHASRTAATASEGRAGQYRWGTAARRKTGAAFWTSVGLLLCEAAGVEPGQVLSNLRDRA